VPVTRGQKRKYHQQKYPENGLEEVHAGALSCQTVATP
jgi:hypothetical protein